MSTTYAMKTSTSLFLALLIMGPVSYSQQTQTDSYTRYELLDPESNSFRIYYYVSATQAGAKYYFNTLRKGSEHIVTQVTDRMSGAELKWEIVDGTKARDNGLTNADLDTEYLMVHLARPIPEGGQARILIDKTYKDPKSYYSDGDKIVFDRSLGIKRNSVVFPAGYELIDCNYPSQIELVDGGKIKVSFMNRSRQAISYKLVGRLLPKSEVVGPTTSSDNAALPWAEYKPTPSGRDKSHARIEYKLNERSLQNRDIVYFLQPPESNSFRLYHDYTESRVGIDKYINVVRKGSKASNPSAIILDTGEELEVETLKGLEITQKGIDIGQDITPDTEVVVIWFDPVLEGQSVRLRIEETYTDPNRYLVHNNELIWDRSFGRNRNTVVLPQGWSLTTNTIPAIIDLNEEGNIRLSFVNDRPDNIDVLIKAQRR